MKREGRQHGMVRLTTATARTLNRFQFPPTTGSFTKVSTKPTNLSKITGKYYSHPACKSKDKGKGTMKIRHSDLTLNRRLISCKVVAGDKVGHNGLNYVGVSASELLGRLSNYHVDDDDYDDEEEEEGVFEFEYDGVGVGVGVVVEEVKIDDGVVGGDDDDDGVEEDDDDMGFCDVGFVVQQLDGEDGWCLVGELGDD